MTLIPTFVHSLTATPSPILTPIPTITSHTIYHVIIDNLSKFSNPTNTLLVALIKEKRRKVSEAVRERRKTIYTNFEGVS